MELTEYKKRIAYLLQKRVNELRINKQDFAELMGTQPSTITRWLSGEHNFTIETLWSIEQKLKISILNIYSYVREKSPACFPAEFTIPINKQKEVTND